MPQRSPYDFKVRDVMATDVVFADADDAVLDVMAQMSDNSVSAVPVVDGAGRCVGVLSATDILRYEPTRTRRESAVFEEESETWEPIELPARREDLADVQVRELMTPAAFTVAPDTPLAEAARCMAENRVHRLPVVDADGRVAGIVSTMDVLRAFAAAAP